MTRPSYGGVPIDDFLVVHAAALEAPQVEHEAVHVLGVGKVAATASLYSTLLSCEGKRPVRGVLLCGIAGAYPERHRQSPPPVGLGGVCLVGSDVLADEGVMTPEGFVDLGRPAFGLPHGLVAAGPFPAHGRMATEAAARLSAPIVRGATVSTCSGVEGLSLLRHRHTGADIETMEGAAVAAVCRRREVPLLHLRAISNWCGDRDRGGWDLRAAVEALRQAVGRLFAR